MVTDLIYLDNWKDYREIEQLLKASFPGCKIEHAPKPYGVCDTRLDFKCNDLEEDDWYRFLMEHGFIMNSFFFQLKLMRAEQDKDQATIDKYVEMIKEINEEKQIDVP